MSDFNLARIDQIEGIEVKATEEALQNYIKLIFDAVNMASFLGWDQSAIRLEEEIVSHKAINMAALSSLQTVNALLTAANTRCRRANPPEDIEMVTDSSGRLIYRCFHKSKHKWDLNGNPIP